MNMIKRCDWLGSKASEIEIKYHDEEWGVPVYDDRLLFEFLTLEGAQSGLSWSIILKKRENYRKAYDGFDPVKIALYDKEKEEELLTNTGIIRNKLKIASSITNAQSFLQVVEEYGSFSSYIWQFVGNKPKVNKWQKLEDIPASTKESEAMSKDLKKRGFKFVGGTICYAFMQAIGMVNDHSIDCFRYKEFLDKLAK